MTTRQALNHLDLSADHMRRARACMSEGDLPQASLEGWLAVTVLVEAAAEQRGWKCDDQLHLRRAMSALAREGDGREMRLQFGLAGTLYRNYAEACCGGWLDAESVGAFLDDIEPLIGKLRRLSTPGA